VWTGGELIVLVDGINPDDGKPYPANLAHAAAYSPASNRWRRIAALPHHRLGERAVWDGHDVVVVAVRSPQFGVALPSPSRQVLAYSPATNRWRQVASMSTGRSQFASVWTGTRVLIWGGTTTAANVPETPPRGLAYNPSTNRWSALPQAPLRPRLAPTAVWTGRAMIVWGGRTRGPQYLSDGAAFIPAVP
jgi:hypothetical protein